MALTGDTGERPMWWHGERSRTCYRARQELHERRKTAHMEGAQTCLYAALETVPIAAR
ncbi:hypothetical protein SAMN05421878_102190 [Actinobaculum suis]|uniref:Uncharacterized protein n=1 Tax=Actinobaculum suis TaxID=1657 RepID=A0A1G7AEL9_9ACTO|nr:hypothetical protein SAMN05421878_102190 [Actinobaculum suis]